jgi:hypothetical protein
MTIDLDTFLTGLYCVVDDVYRAEFAPRRPVRRGHKAELSDSEVLTLAVLFQWLPRGGERRFLAYAASHWRSYFPRLLSQGAFNRRVHDLVVVLSQLGPQVVQQVFPILLSADFEVLDGLPVPLMRRCRGDAHRLFADDAGIGRGGSDMEWYYGVKMVAAVSPSGIVTGFVIAPASTEERWSVDALLRWRNDPSAPPPNAAALAEVLGTSHRLKGRRRGPTGPLHGCFSAGQTGRGCYLADEGERGAAWHDHWARDYGASVLTASALIGQLSEEEAPPFRRSLRRSRQVVETIFSSLERVFGIKFPRARTVWGLIARIGAKVAAHNLLTCLNYRFERPAFSLYDPFSQYDAQATA